MVKNQLKKSAMEKKKVSRTLEVITKASSKRVNEIHTVPSKSI